MGKTNGRPSKKDEEKMGAITLKVPPEMVAFFRFAGAGSVATFLQAALNEPTPEVEGVMLSVKMSFVKQREIEAESKETGIPKSNIILAKAVSLAIRIAAAPDLFCKKCFGKMKPSLAIVPSIISGDDFGDGETAGATLSFGTGNVGSMKCENCGHSYNLQKK